MSKPASSKQCEKEKELNKIRLHGWSVEQSQANAYLVNRFQKFNKPFIVDLAKVVSIQLQIPFDREAQRNKTVCIKWFDENFTRIKPFLETSLCVLDENFQHVGAQTQASLQILETYKKQISQSQSQNSK